MVVGRQFARRKNHRRPRQNRHRRNLRSAERRLRLGPQLPRPADQIVALTVADRLYAIGGANDEGPVPDVLSIAVDETKWSHHAPAPGPLMQASGCVLSGKIYIAAGPSAQCPGLFVYDPQQDRWDQIIHPASQPPSAPMCTAFAGGAYEDDRIGNFFNSDRVFLLRNDRQ